MSEQSTNTITQMDLLSRQKTNIGKKGLKIGRYYTKANQDVYSGITFEKRTSKIVNPDGTTVFEMKNVEVPSTWSQVATDILAQKYLRKKGVPQLDEAGKPVLDKDGNPTFGAETSSKQAMHRLAGTWRHWGEKYNYFETAEDAENFEAEVKYMLMDQTAVPNSPQWFNTGLHWAYGINGGAQGHYYVDPDTGTLKKSPDAYSHPQPHACFIQSVKDDLVGEGGLFDVLTREARLFKYGSGTGTNFSAVRGKGESLAGGGSSSGLMSFLKVFDAGAGAIQSGGTTRRAAKMVVLNVDHPEIETFIDWKVREEQKVVDLVTGSQIAYKYLKKVMESAEANGIDPEKNPELKKIIKEAKDLFVPLNYIKRVLMLSENGMKSKDFNFEKYDVDFRSEAYSTVSGQNSNNTVRVTNEYIEAVQNNADWQLYNRTDGKARKTLKARDIWDKINYAAWASADPGLQFHDTVNEWHTCPADGPIVASNPCSEYMFLDETACNLYQINLIKFYDSETGVFDIKGFAHCVRLSTIILEISVLMSQLPSDTMAVGTYNYRTLGLGYANLGVLLMQMGLPYDSETGFAVTAAINAIMGGEAYATSAEMAANLGTFNMYPGNKKDFLRVIRNHRRAAYSADNSEYEGLTIKPFKFQSDLVEPYMTRAAREAWDYALFLGEEYGYRNAQVTCIAPTGTTGLLMDCDTTGIEPDFALVKFKKLVGGGYFKIVNQSLEPALKKLGYPSDQIRGIIDYVVGAKTLEGAPYINTDSLKKKGFAEEQLAAIEAVLPSVIELKYAFSKWTIGEEFITKTLGISADKLKDSDFDLLAEMGFSEDQIEAASEFACGTMTVEGAPYLKQEHYAVFDCANKCGTKGTRYIHYLGHLRQMAAAQPFLSGAISKTINLPEEATISDVEKAYIDSWQLMLKATALYRDGSKLSQPLSSVGSSDSVYAKLFNFSEDAVDEFSIEKVQKAMQIESNRPLRRRLPSERNSITHKFVVGGHEGYVTVGLFEDGTPGEIFMTMSKEGSTLSGIVNALAVSLSLNLQYGVPLETLINTFVNVRFEPNGISNNAEIPLAKSIIDYIGRWLGLKFLPREKAKQYHNAELVDKAYSIQGSNTKLHLPEFASSDDSVIKFSSKDTNSQVLVMQTEKMEGTYRSDAPESIAKGVKAATGSTPTADSLAAFQKSQQQLANGMNNSSAPMCAECGAITMKNGSCYKCPDCGSTTGCS